MIQDDPINTAKPIYTDHVGYFPLNLNSVEEIVVQDIEVSELIPQKGSLLDGESKDDSKIYYKYAMLIGLYVMQGIPLGLVFGAIPYMLKSMKSNTLSYSQFGLFSLAGYPYSLKLFWSPIVDQIYSRRIGRRKSWIIPTQLLVGSLFYVLGQRIDSWIVPGKGVDFWRLNGCFLILVTLCATLDVAVDGWALTILPQNKIHYASTCQSVGINIGLFISFTVFLALSSEKFCSQFLGLNRDTGIFTLGSFMKFWAGVYVLATFALIFKREILPESLRTLNGNRRRRTRNTFRTIISAYKTLWGIITLPTVRSFALILLIFKFGFSAYDAVAPLKLLEKGFPKEYLALTVLIDFPFQMAMGFFVARWSAGSRTFRPWIIATYFRIIMSLVGLYVISKFPQQGLTTSYTVLIIFTTILTSFCHTTMFVSLAAYFVKISDPKYGGTYLTLLNTLSNFAGMWPKLPVMSAVDWLTIKKCSVSISASVLDNKCTSILALKACSSAGGVCNVEADGFYLVATLCLVIGFAAFQFWIKPAIRRLEIIPKHQWTVQSASTTSISQLQ